jgi:hypothetical protein
MKLFLALAQCQQKQPDQARTWREKVQLADDARWEERLIDRLLRAELARLEKGS